MSLDLTIDRSKDDVTSAIYEFAARRGLAATTPWYLDGIRIEDARPGAAEAPSPVKGSTFWGSLAGFFTPPAPGPVVSIEMSRRKKKTRVVMSLGAHPGSVALAQAIRTYLQDDRAFDVNTPLTCSRCAAQILHFIARFCGRCGQPLGTVLPPDSLPQRPMAQLPPSSDSRVSTWISRSEQSSERPLATQSEQLGSTARDVVSPRVVVERDDPIPVAPATIAVPETPTVEAEKSAFPKEQPAEPRRQRLAESDPATESD